MSNKTIKDFPEAIVELNVSKTIPGEIGLFAVRDLKIGQIVGEASMMDESVFISWNEYPLLDEGTRRVVDRFCLGNNDGFFAPKNINYLSIPWYINHSCSGNVGFDEKGNFVVIKEVKAGDELFYDYGLAEANSKFSMVCKCGSANCRKIITGDDHKDEAFYSANRDYIMPELRK